MTMHGNVRKNHEFATSAAGLLGPSTPAKSEMCMLVLTTTDSNFTLVISAVCTRDIMLLSEFAELYKSHGPNCSSFNRCS